MAGLQKDMARAQGSGGRFWPRLRALQKGHSESRSRLPRLMSALRIDIKRWKTKRRENPKAGE